MTTRCRELIQEDCRLVTTGQPGSLEALRHRTLLITGGTGFVGTWIAELITFLNDTQNLGVRLLLLSSHANDFAAKAPELAARTDIQLIKRDVRGLFEITPEVEYIIHAAGNPDHRMHATDPISTMNVIAQGTGAVLQAALTLPNLRGLLYISSGLVYGQQPWELAQLPESYTGAIAHSSSSACYAEAKRFAEMLCDAYRRQSRLPIVIARPFAFIGPYQLLDRPWAINNFIRDCLMGGPIRILGDGSTVRSYMYPSDMAYWLLRILLDGAIGTCYNVGSPHGISLAKVAERIALYSQKRPEILFNQARESQSSRFVPDTSLASRTLGLHLTVDIDTAIQRTLLWNQARNA